MSILRHKNQKNNIQDKTTESYSKKKKKKLYQGKKINDLNVLKLGEYEVHEKHELSIYKSIAKEEVDKVVNDYL